MKITLNWLKQYVDFNWSPEELAERLTMLGIEVEGVQKKTGDFEGVVVAQILSSNQHPNADKLSVCKVADGQGERQIVCGAKNYKVGDKVPLALPGCTLPTPAGAPPFTIKVGKLRGVESQGMMCSAKELGLAEDAEGLLILPTDAKVGQPLAQHLGRASGDVIYDLEITPNRPDLNSFIGIAREISALTRNSLKIPDTAPADAASIPDTAAAYVPSKSKSLDPITAEYLEGVVFRTLVDVRLDDPELCPRYTARIVRGVKVGPSPDWLKAAIESIGLRSINNVVDVTNYVLMECGQPLHAFDYKLIQPKAGSIPTIVVRRAAAGEKFKTLDGQERTLTDKMLLIADESRGIALAGVMGGQNSEINDATTDVLIESAYFKPQNIRATSKALDLRTDASYRFERGADIGVCDWASRRAAQLIQQVAGGTVVDGVVDAYPNPAKQTEITLRHEKVTQLLGVQITEGEQTEFLRRLGLDVSSTPGQLTARVPTFRVDLKRDVDLIEEIARLYGVDKIPSTPPRGAIGQNPFDAVYDQLAEVRHILAAQGLSEACGQTLISDVSAKLIDPNPVALENPLSSDMNVLRPSLLPGLLDSLRHNAHHKNHDASLFELGRVFLKVGPAVPASTASAGPRADKQVPNNQPASSVRETTTESRRVAIALTGARNPLFWSGEERDAKLDAYDLKGIVEILFERLGLRGLQWTRATEPKGPYIESATITLGKQTLGTFGQLQPVLARKYDLRDPVFIAEFDLDLILARRNAAKSFKAIPQFPGIRRDIAMLVPETVTHENVASAVKQLKPQNLESLELFDIFRGKNIPEGQKSVAYAFHYRNPQRTLTDNEVNAAHDRVVAELKTRLNAAIRE
jgi:phenylalanyl-tRNA synthetase beta chain